MNDDLRFKLALRALEMVERIALMRQAVVEPVTEGPAAVRAKPSQDDEHYMDDAAEDLLTRALNFAIKPQPQAQTYDDTLEPIDPADLDALTSDEDA
jgi:hypothetical protein